MMRSTPLVAVLLVARACARQPSQRCTNVHALQPSQRCRKPHAGGANNAFSDWQRSFRREAPITYALAASHLMTFVASTRPKLRHAIVGHAVCCRRALQMRRFHTLVAHALVTGTPSQLGFGLLALYLVAKPVEASAGSQRFARFALASIIAGGCATAASQSLGASGGVTGSGALVYACGAVYILRNPNSPVHLFYVARPFQASHVGAALVAWDSLMAVCGHPGSAAHLGGALAGWVFHRYGLLAPRSRFTVRHYSHQARPPPVSAVQPPPALTPAPDAATAGGLFEPQT
jgi:membrane associated rhomboid family serine protease